jgi:succinoglycan biosynthesis protein ExoA
LILLPVLSNQKPFVSIILAIKDEEKYIENTLKSILDQDYPFDNYEVLIADGNSKDATLEIVNEIASGDPRVQIFSNPGEIVAKGLNILIRQAKGEVIIRADGHTILESDYVSKCVSTLFDHQVQNVGGRMDGVASTPFGEAVVRATSSRLGVGDSAFHYSTRVEEVDSVYLGAWPAELFTEIGLFDEELVRNQDDEFNYRLRKHGGKIMLNPEIKSHYNVRSRPGTFWRQYFQYGFWKIRVLQKHLRQMSLRHFIPAIFMLGLVACVFVCLLIPFLRILGFGFILFYFVTTLLSALNISDCKVPKALRVCLAYWCMHTAYGLGFIVGLFRFWNRWGDKKGQVPEF